jgi:hypothetical protein
MNQPKSVKSVKKQISKKKLLKNVAFPLSTKRKAWNIINWTVFVQPTYM